MNFKEYQEKVKKSAIYPEAGNNYVYPTLGLSGEAGEVAEKIKKVMTDNGGIIDEKTRELIEKELGDVLWYVSQLATELKITLEEVAKKNIEKVYDRIERGVSLGNGDER